MREKGYVIIGGSAAGLSAAKAIRRKDRDTALTIISEERFAYSRIAISKYLTGEMQSKNLALVEDDFYNKNRIKTVFSNRVTTISPKGRCVILQGDEEIKYTKLLLTTGSKPIVPKMEGIDKHGVFYFWTLEDAGKIRDFIEENRRSGKAVVIGGGLIGFQAALALVKLNLRVSIVEKLPSIFPKFLDETAVHIVMRKAKEMGIKIVTDATVNAILGREKITGIEVNGIREDADLVVVAVGVKPNVSLGHEAGLAVNKGLLVDKGMRTNEPDIYAAGDAAEVVDLVDGERKVMAIWPSAVEGGKVAGHNMACGEQIGGRFLLMNSLHIGNLYIVTLGLSWLGDGDGFYTFVRYTPERNSYRKLVCSGGKLVGAILIGDFQSAGFLRTLIEKGVSIEKFVKPIMEGKWAYGPQGPGWPTLPSRLTERHHV